MFIFIVEVSSDAEKLMEMEVLEETEESPFAGVVETIEGAPDIPATSSIDLESNPWSSRI